MEFKKKCRIYAKDTAKEEDRTITSYYSLKIILSLPWSVENGGGDRGKDGLLKYTILLLHIIKHIYVTYNKKKILYRDPQSICCQMLLGKTSINYDLFAKLAR